MCVNRGKTKQSNFGAIVRFHTARTNTLIKSGRSIHRLIKLDVLRTNISLLYKQVQQICSSAPDDDSLIAHNFALTKFLLSLACAQCSWVYFLVCHSSLA